MEKHVGALMRWDETTRRAETKNNNTVAREDLPSAREDDEKLVNSNPPSAVSLICWKRVF